MSKYGLVHLFYFLTIIFIIFTVQLSSSELVEDERKVYIVYMGSLPEGEYLSRVHHVNLIQDLGYSHSIVDKILVRSYTRSFNGFAAKLTPKEVLYFRRAKGVISVFERQRLRTQTTKSWDYIGFPLNVPQNLTMEKDIIIGHFDSGLLPELPSFSDHGLTPVPKKWKGVCEGGKNFTCNKKVIGARYYTIPLGETDETGHGSHTASIAAGRIIENTSFFGISNGTARGGVPSSRIATYKVCLHIWCQSEIILAAFDDAIADNVDIITISIAFISQSTLSEDIYAIGSFHAMEKNILTVHAAGNNGDEGLGSTFSIAPWLFTVAASSERKIFNQLIIHNGPTIVSNAVNTFEMSKNTSLIYGINVTSHCTESIARQCSDDCLDPSLIKGKIILCNSTDHFHILSTAAKAGVSGVILRESLEKDIYMIVSMPVAILNESNFREVESYLMSKIEHLAYISKSEMVSNPAPVVAHYSSKGPNKILPGIFKPDITAPGNSILAAHPPLVNITTSVENYKRINTNFTFLSGTSMACPHVTGAAAYVKSMHPDWSPSIIKSSLMTTARDMNGKSNLEAEFGYGAGHLDPVKATDPGLVYETSLDEYLQMFCSLGSEGNKLRDMFKVKTKCPEGIKTSLKDLNYPAMTASVIENSSFTIQFSRVVTNVGNTNSTYHAQISTSDNTIFVDVKPSILSFVHLKERKSFLVTVKGQWLNQNYISCSLIWFDGTHKVRSPIILYKSTLV